MLIKLNESQLKNKTPQQSFCLLFGEVNTEQAQNIISWILEANFTEEERPEVLNLLINSYGGSLSAGFSIIDAIRGSAIPVRTIATGEVASAGLLISLSGQKGYRFVTENTSIMSHQYTWGNMGKHHELIAAVKEYDLISEKLVAHYKKCTGLKEDKIKKALLPPQDVYLTPQEAVEYNLFDKIVTLK